MSPFGIFGVYIDEAGKNGPRDRGKRSNNMTFKDNIDEKAADTVPEASKKSLNDSEIIDLYFSRQESAISETDKKYGPYCRNISYNILESREDSEECTNDTYMKLWNTIPPQRPQRFCAFIASVVRSIALNMIRSSSAAKRGGGNVQLVFDEIAECIADKDTVESSLDDKELVKALNGFLKSCGTEKQQIFMKRYYHFRSVSQIAEEMNISEDKVKQTLHRTREKLRKHLEKEGIDI